MMKQTNMRSLTHVSICIAMLAVSSYLYFPLPFLQAPITAQTIMVNVIALWLPRKQAMTTIGIYLMMGVIGFPVFAGGSSGIAALASPTGGFLIAFFISTCVISGLKQRLLKTMATYLGLTIGVGMPLIYLIGALWMSHVMKVNLATAFQLSVTPFILGDFLKCVIASGLVMRLERIFTMKYSLVMKEPYMR